MSDESMTHVILFGATGDLARRKLYPALAALHATGTAGTFHVVGAARRPNDAARMDEAIQPFLDDSSRPGWPALLEHCSFVQADISDVASLERLRKHLEGLPGGADAARLCYLALGPDLFVSAADNLVQSGIMARCVHSTDAPRRLLVEKPFGTSLKTARELNEALHALFEEEQVLRIDHYLGKETVQNLLGFRFHNAIFEPLWNRHHVELVEITVAETVGMESGRAAYYDGSGALRDMLQNHILQILAMVAMEPPSSLEAETVRDQKVQVLRGLIAPDPAGPGRAVVRARYAAGEVGGEIVPGYLEEPGVAADSDTETYVAVRAEIDTWRWSGVPFLLRHGKRLGRRQTEVRVQFKTPPLQLFNQPPGVDDREYRTALRSGELCEIRPNVLTLGIQPEERITLGFGVKRPGAEMVMAPAELAFDYRSYFGAESAPAYERLLQDALNGDATLFLRADEIEASWAFADQVLEDFRDPRVPMQEYRAGSWGPEIAEELFYGCEGGWSSG
ncbi:MAG: glucose-6-phosphate dehydrogenase [Pseudomonadota bacterium]